jgi:lipoprotein NlpD
MRFRSGKIGFALPVPVLMFFLLINFSACSSKGSAPVYSRDSVSSSRQVNAPIHQQERKSIRFKSHRTYYLVQAGDTLYSIAWRHYLEHEQLAVWNGIKAPSYAIYPGQRLRLKPPETKPKRAISSNRVNHPVTLTKKKQPAARIKPSNQSSVKSIPAKRAVVTKSKKSVKLAWSWPTKGRVAKTFSADDQNRKGVWISGNEGQAIKAAEAGKVVYAGSGLVGYGNLVIIKHDQEFLSAYGYNRKLLVKEGDKLAKGDIVAYMGLPNRGGQPMLHFEIRKQGKPINPLPLLPRK